MIKKSYQYLQFELEQAIGILTIDREDKLNALNSDLIEELRSFLQEISDKPLSGMILTSGKHQELELKSKSCVDLFQMVLKKKRKNNFQ